MKSSYHPDEIAIVALDIKKLGAGFTNFKKLTAKQKIKLIEKTILISYEEFKKSGKKLIIFVWREYAITDPNRRSISSQDKTFFKKILCKLTKDQKDLLIIAGPTLIRKKIKNIQSTKEKLISYYKKNDWSKEKTDQEQEAKELKKIIGMGSKNDTFFSMLGVHPLIKYKTSLFIAYNGEIVSRIGKSAVYDETKEEPTRPNKSIVQPAKNRNFSRVYKFKELTLGFDICRDHANGLLKKYSIKYNIPVDIQFVLSDSYSLRLDNLCGNLGTVYVDSIHALSYVKDNESKDSSFKLYGINLLKNSKTVEVPFSSSLQYYSSHLTPQFLRILDYFKSPIVLNIQHLLPMIADNIILGTVEKSQIEKLHINCKMLQHSKYEKLRNLFTSMDELLMKSLGHCLYLMDEQLNLSGKDKEIKKSESKENILYLFKDSNELNSSDKETIIHINKRKHSNN